jgi:restriction system protein
MTEVDHLPNPKVPHYPTNDSERRFIALMDGQSQRTFFDMRYTIENASGTPQATQDWTNPDNWIPRILTGKEEALARHIWETSEGIINPRYLVGIWLLGSNYGLLDVGNDSILRLSPAGHDFIENPDGETVRYIDYMEGLLNLLLIVSEHGPGRRSQFMDPLIEFLTTYSKYRSKGAIDTTWYGRIKNLTARGLVERSGQVYEITQAGLNYLESVSGLLRSTGRESATEQQVSIRQLVKDQQETVRQNLRETLADMNPFLLEYLIKRLLEAMGYENVEVTSQSGDGGVDVVADIEVGITPVREVVQVKRHKANIQRSVLDQLRGSLYRFSAMRGTIITTGGFTEGAREVAFAIGAAPITLIDGEHLVDLLIEHEIGVRKRSVQLLEFEPLDFEDSELGFES